MLGVFDAIRDKFRVKDDVVFIDNWVFQLHYRATTIIFSIASILVTAREFIGDHIRCINDMRDYGFDRVIDSFCFFTTTFSVVEENDSLQPHRGISAYGISSTKPIRKHMYYQWVPYFFFLQAILFYLTHLLWKTYESGRIKHLVSGLKLAKFAFLSTPVSDEDVIPTMEQKKSRMRVIKQKFLERLKVNKSWGRWLIFCEVVNVFHVVFQAFITHKFLGNQFYALGVKVIANGSKVLDVVFPKMTKCTFYKYGPSGSIQIHDALCVMAINIVNEKIFLFLWFWFVFLFGASCLILLWRLLSLALYSRCMCLNQIIFGRGKLYYGYINMVIRHCSYSDWLFLKYLAKNLDNATFRELFQDISDELEDRKPAFLTLQRYDSAKYE